MASVILWPPLGAPMQYDPSFKVDVCLHEPLLGGCSGPHGLDIELLTLCAQLDLLCKKELNRQLNHRIDNGKVSNCFEGKAAIVLNKLQSLMQKMPYPQPQLDDYLEYTGFSKLYPRTAAYVVRPNDLSLVLKKTQMDDYFSQLALLHQLTAIAHQLNSDVRNLNNHKYIAHQIAILYQSILSLGDIKCFSEIKKNIEENFTTVKEILTPRDGDHVPCLTEDYAQWLLDVTDTVISVVTAYPQELTKEIFSAATVLSRIT